MKSKKILCLVISSVLLLTVLPFGTSALGNNAALRETYAIYELDLNCLDNFILLHFYESEAYKVFIDMELTRNREIQSMYKRLKAELTGEETPEEVFPIFEEIIYNEVLQKELSAKQLARFVGHTPDTLKNLGVDVTALLEAGNTEAALETIAGVPYDSIKDLAEALKKITGSIPLETEKDVFSDIANVSWAEEAINYLSEAGIIGGKSKGIFAPNDALKREELSKILVLAFELKEKAEVSFSDCDKDAWYYEFLGKTVQSGLMKGYGDVFGIGDAVTREDLAVICGRYLETEEKTVEGVGESSVYSDESEISDYAKEYVKTLSDMGIVNGTESGAFAPKAFVTRAQAAKIIYETLKTVKGGEYK